MDADWRSHISTHAQEEGLFLLPTDVEGVQPSYLTMLKLEQVFQTYANSLTNA